MSCTLDLVSFETISETSEEIHEQSPATTHGLFDFETTDISPISYEISEVSQKIMVQPREQKRYIPVHSSVREKLDAFYESKKIPHIIFHGASGTGKLTLVNEFIRRIYNGDKQRIKSNVMTVNCSHGKGIRFIRDELKFFAKTNIPTNSGVLFKTILLINAHHLTIDAQSALRRCIELFSYNTRFFIVLENKNKLLNPILSRFCEIYIPEYTDETNQIINLHTHSLSQTYDAGCQKQEIREYIDIALLDNNGKCRTTLSEPLFTNMVEEFYMRGISCLDLMDWFSEHRELWGNKQYVNSIMCFQRIKTEFRCEKMLLFYMLDFIFCSKWELPIT